LGIYNNLPEGTVEFSVTNSIDERFFFKNEDVSDDG